MSGKDTGSATAPRVPARRGAAPHDAMPDLPAFDMATAAGTTDYGPAGDAADVGRATAEARDGVAGLRVAHVLPFLGVGGTEQATLRLACAVRADGVESVAVCLDSAPVVHALFREAGIETATWHPRDVAGWGWKSFAYRTAQLAWTLRKRGVRVVHCADVYAVQPQIVLAARLAGAVLVCHVRNRVTTISDAQRASLDAVRQFVFVSKATWQDCGYLVAPERGTVLYDGVTVSATAPDARARAEARAAVAREVGIAPDAPLVGMVARVEPQKDFPTLLRAMALLRADLPTLHVLVIGGTDATPEQRAHFPEVRQVAEACGVADRVHFLGFRTDVPHLVRALDVSVLATHWEGLPLVLWEAMAEGTPVVATAVDGVPEAVRDGETGCLVRHADPAHLARVLSALLADPARARALGAAGQEHARRAFSEARFRGEALAVYRAARTARTARTARSPRDVDAGRR